MVVCFAMLSIIHAAHPFHSFVQKDGFAMVVKHPIIL